MHGEEIERERGRERVMREREGGKQARPLGSNGQKATKRKNHRGGERTGEERERVDERQSVSSV
jgi:hypothetical protein